MNNVLILLSGSLYLINLLNLFSILLGESLYSNLKFVISLLSLLNIQNKVVSLKHSSIFNDVSYLSIS